MSGALAPEPPSSIDVRPELISVFSVTGETKKSLV